jgi:hypothetical protein
MSNKTIYVYDSSTGKVKYTIEDVSPDHVKNMNKKGDEFYVGDPGQRLAGTFVKKDPGSGLPIGITPIQHMTFVNINKHTIVANGTDEAVVSGLLSGMSVDINHEYTYQVESEDDKTIELTCNNYSYLPQHNEITVYLKAYGYHDSSLKVQVVEEA